jgi:anti-sigma28 factor (negative regulator of flagellin synthesis)
MAINSISGHIYSQNIFENKKTAKITDDKSKNSDKIELSSQAKEMLKAQNNNKIEEITQRINEGFYSQKEVSDRVATSILKEFMQK